LVEDSAIWKAKSGEDVGGTELTLLTDRDGNVSDLALRPEMTPTVTRMVTKKWNELPKPVRWFSIANFYRNERPQR
jgi:histidyl-tRNA synthetase